MTDKRREYLRMWRQKDRQRKRAQNQDLKPKVVQRWYQKIGSRGGQAGRDNPERVELMRRASNIRWDRYRAAKAKEEAKMREHYAGVMPASFPQVGFK